MIVSTWTRTEVRALRDAALRMTQEKFAEVLGFKVETIQKWEQKATSERPVRGQSAEALDTAYAQLRTEQRERFWSEISRAQTSAPPVLTGTSFAVAVPSCPDSAEFGTDAWKVDNDVRRREFTKLAVVAGTAMLLPDDQVRIGMSDVGRVLAGVDALEREDQRVGGGALVDCAVEQLERAKNRLDTSAYDTATGNAFTSATGELAVLAGWLAYDADRHGLARRCFADAMALGTEADDSDLIAHTCLYAANQSCSLARSGQGGSPYKALHLADRARSLMRGRPPSRIHALIAVREAQAYGMLRDRMAFGRAIATAWRELDQAVQFEPLEEVPQWLRFVTHAEVADHEARGYADVDDLPRSVELYAAAVERPAGIRNATIVRAWSAATRARLGDISGALEHGHQALVNLSAMTSTRTLRRLEPVRTAVDRLPSGAEFRDRYDSLTRQVISA